jgi:hypothetical protein
MSRIRAPRTLAAGVWVLASFAIATASYLHTRASLPAPRINVRWVPGVDDRERVALEKTFKLTDGEFTERRTFSYRLDDVTRANVAAILANSRVEDTDGINRESLHVAGEPDPLAGLSAALIAGFVPSTLALVAVIHRRRLVDAWMRVLATLRQILEGLPSRESRRTSATFLAMSVVIATVVKLPSWSAVAWDDEELWMSILTTSQHARFWGQGIWLPLWNPLQGFGVPHPYVTHLIYTPLFPLMLVLPAGTALSLHYSIVVAIGVTAIFLLSRRLGASPFLAGVAALTWLSSCFVTQLMFVDFWTQAFTFANAAPAFVLVVLDYLDTPHTVRIQDVLWLGLAGGIALNCTTPAGSVPFAIPLAVIGAVFARRGGLARIAWIVPALAIAVAMYAPSLVELWQEMGRFDAVRRHTMTNFYSDMVRTALLWPVSGSVRSAGLGAPFAVVALFSLAWAFLPARIAAVTRPYRAMAAAGVTCVVLYVLPSTAFPIASGNGEWGQLLTVFAIPLAAAQITTWYRSGVRGRQILAWTVIAMQLTLVCYWGGRWWMFQREKSTGQGVGTVLNQSSELERALLQRVQPYRDRVLLSSATEEWIFRRVDFGHASNFARVGIPLVNGQFKFVSYRNVYPDPDVTWGLIRTHDEQLRPEILDVAGISLLVTLDHETPADASMRLVGRYAGHGSSAFQVWENVDAWPRVSFVDGAVEQQPNAEAGSILWRRRLLPSRLPDAVTYEMRRPGSYSIRFEPSSSDRFLMISEAVRTDLLTVRGASIVRSGPFSDVFTILKVPAGAQSIDVTWETPLRRWLWTISYLTFGLTTLAYVIARLRNNDRHPSSTP